MPSLRIASWSVLALLVVAGAVSAHAETWTDLRGNRSVEAKLIGIWGDNVILQLQSGRRVTIKLSGLRSESRIQAKRLQAEIDRSRGRLVEELQLQAAEALAPAPNPLPSPPKAPDYQPPAKDVTVTEFLDQIERAVADGHLVAIYDALPPRYRKDVNDIVKLATEKIDPANWATVFGTAYQLGDLVVTRQRWVFSSPRMQSLPPDQRDNIKGQWLLLAGLLRTGCAADVMDLRKFKTTSFGEWLAEFDKTTSPYLAALFQQTNRPFRQITLEPVSGLSPDSSIEQDPAENPDGEPSSNAEAGAETEAKDDLTATVTIESNGLRSTLTYTKVDGYWVPKTLADSWAERVSAIKKRISDANLGTLLSPYSTILEPIGTLITPLEQAENPKQFHDAMESMLSPTGSRVTTLMTRLRENFDFSAAPPGS